MLTVKRQGDGLVIANRASEVGVGLNDRAITLDGQTITSPGEYERNGVEVIYGVGAALIVSEGVQIAIAFEAKPGAFEKNQFTPCDVLITGATEEISNLLETYDPKVLVLTSPLPEGAGRNLSVAEVDQVKLTSSGLPTEGREHFLLQPANKPTGEVA